MSEDEHLSTLIQPFTQRYRRALGDERLQRSLLVFQRSWRTTRDAVIGQLDREVVRKGTELPSAEARHTLIAAKDAVLADPAAARDRFMRAFIARGGVVHEAATAADARAAVLAILQARGAHLVAKGKSMVAEEVFLNHHLEQSGIRVVETDLGEWIVQLSHETPSHMVMPAIHKSRDQVAALFEAEIGKPVDRDDVAAMVSLARNELREVFLEADAGIIGANALIADSGTVMLVTNEGNGDLVSTLPHTLIVLAGWEKLLPTLTDATAQLRLLARSATGQELTSYTSFLTGPEPERELHLVLVDNGRSAMHADPAFRDALRCIRCAACADVCPPYQIVGGQVFGHVYSGAIGLVNTKFHHGLDAAAGPQSLCVSCNACATVCPVEIPLPAQILAVRAMVAETQGLRWQKKLALRLWESPRVFDLVLRIAATLQRPLRRGRSLRLPLPPAWRWRTVPAVAPRPARDTLGGRVFEADEAGPWVASAARGLTVAYFLQCVTDRFAPEQAEAAIGVMRACGVRVVVPAGQHCCGLPALDAGDRATARRMAKRTIDGLDSTMADFVVSAAASCAIAILHDYARLFADEPAWRTRAERLAERTLDLVSFLERIARPQDLAGLGATEATVTVHPFCQSTNVLGIGGAGARLLRCAGYQVHDLPEAEVCCGFGGGTSIEHPALTSPIVRRKLDNVRATGATVLVSDNPGCLLHLRGAAEVAGDGFAVRHVAELLADALGPSRRPSTGA